MCDLLQTVPYEQTQLLLTAPKIDLAELQTNLFCYQQAQRTSIQNTAYTEVSSARAMLSSTRRAS